MRRSHLLISLLAITASNAAASAPPWVEAGSPQVGPNTRSIRIHREDEPILQTPNQSAKRRGSASKGALLPIFAARSGPGCESRWWLVGPDAWICGDRVTPSAEPSRAQRHSPTVSLAGLPYDYYFVGAEGSLGYAKLSLAEEGIPDAELQPGFAVAVIQQANRHPGDPFALTTKGLWLPMRDLRPSRPSTFQGLALESDSLNIGWVLNQHPPVYERPNGSRLSDVRLARQSALEILESRRQGGQNWVKTSGGLWLRARDVRVANRAPVPDGVFENERWIDVDVANQILTAYEGPSARFVTLVSTGKGRGKSPLATPTGLHRIWVKLRTSDMTNLENEEAERYYAIEEVPWVMFFNKGYGLHGAFWHQSFGNVRSHGCVNMAPLDAEWLFHWTSPRLPSGWSAVLPTEYDRGTLVRVR